MAEADTVVSSRPPWADCSSGGMSLSLARLAALSLTIGSGRPMYTEGRLLMGRLTTREGEVLLDPSTGNELRASEMPAFILSTDGEATDGNIVEQHWDLSRADAGIAPILLNHTVRGSPAPLGVGLWRAPKVQDLEKGRGLVARADFDRGESVGDMVAGKVGRGYLRSVSVGWRPGGKMLRGDLPKDHPRYRDARSDECGTRIEGYVMGTEGDPNELVEASMTPIPADPGAVQADGRETAQRLDVGDVGDRADTRLGLGAFLLAVRDVPQVRQWVARQIVEEIASGRLDEAIAARIAGGAFDLIGRGQAAPRPISLFR